MSDTMTSSVTCGALLRRRFRADLDAGRIAYKEHKGLFDSIFVVTATRPQWRAIQRWAASV